MEVDELDIKVRVSETDMLGHINNASYFTYMEETRIEYLREIGIPIKSDNFAFVLVSTKCDFLGQGYFGQTLEITTEVVKIGTKSITLSSEMVEKESRNIIARGEAIIVYLDFGKQKAIELPDSFRRKLEVGCEKVN